MIRGRYVWRGIVMGSLVAGPQLKAGGSEATPLTSSTPRIESVTRFESSLVLGADSDTGCPSASQLLAESVCVQHSLLEALTATLPVNGVPGLTLAGSLRYGTLLGDAPRADLLTSYATRQDLKVLGLTATWRSPARKWSAVLGRQSRWDADPLLFDGLLVRWREASPRAAQSMEVTLYGGLWSGLDADVRAQALYGALFGQEVPTVDAQGSAVLLPVQNVSPGVVGMSLLWRPLWPLELGLSDTFYLGLHHTRAGVRWEPLPSLTLWGEARTLDIRPRDVRLGLESMQVSTGSSLSLQLRHTFEGEFPLGALSHGVNAQGAQRLLVGNLEPYSELRLDVWHPLTSHLLAGVRLGLTQVDGTDEQAYQRSLFEVGIQSYWQPFPRVSATLDLVQVLAPQAGQFSEAGEIVINDGEGDVLDLNTFPNLSGEGEEAMLELASQVRVRLGARVHASLGGGAVWLQKAYTAFVTLEDGAGGRLWIAGQWEPTRWLRADVRYLLEQDLNAGLYGWYSTAHEASVGLRARW